MAPLQRYFMRKPTAAGMTALLLTVLLVPFAHGADSTVTVNTTWSGNVTLAGNVTVAPGATLTVSSGTVVDAKSYSIVVEGALIATDASFFSSVPPITQGSHGQGLWEGVHVKPSGTAEFTNVVVSNASSGVLVEGSFVGDTVTFNDAYRGISVAGGSATVEQFTANRIDFEALYVSAGTLNLSFGHANEVAVGLANHAQANVTDLTVQEAGIAIQSNAGSLNLTGLGIINASVGVATRSGAISNISSVTSSGVALAIDAGDADGFTLTEGQFSGHRMMVGQGISSSTLRDVEFTGNATETRATVDVNCVGTCTMDEIVLSGVQRGLALSGTGAHHLNEVSISATLQALEATGAGHLGLSNTTLSADDTVLSVQTPTSTFATVNVSTASSDATGVDVLGGVHAWSDVVLSKPFTSADRSSLGLSAWYADLTVDHLTVRNFSTSADFDDSSLRIETFEANIGSTAGMILVDSAYSGQSLTTVAQEQGVVMQGMSTLHLSSWTAQLHDTPLLLGAEAEAVVRSFSPVNTAPSNADASGDGTLYYGSSANPTIATASAFELLETDVTFTDLQGNPVQADVHAHGFALMSNSNGALTLPLMSSGSTVDVTLDGAGVRVQLYGGQTGQSVQVPVIPQGDWTIASGQEVVLGPRPDGQPHQLSGDLTIGNNAVLTLQGTTLSVPVENGVTLQGSATLLGVGGLLSASSVQASGSSMLSGTLQGVLTVQADLAWGCLSERVVERLEVNGDLTVQPGCEIQLSNGSISGTVVAQTGARFTSISTLDVTVLDKGQPVQGALISVDGAVAVTDQTGQVTTSTTSQTVTDSGTTWAGVKTVTMQRNNFTGLVAWDTNQSLAHTFMASTVPTGDVGGWVILERQWSPYTLDASLVLLAGSTLTIQDGVSLRISEEATITVNGVFDAGEATLSSTGFGARWGGLAMGDSTGASIELTNTQLVESSPAITVSGNGHLLADGVLMARSASTPLMVVESGSATDVVLRNSRMQDSGNGCANLYPSTGRVTLTNVTFASCDGSAVWAQQVEVAFDTLTFEDGVDQGLYFTDVSGEANNIDATGFAGDDSIVYLSNMRAGFSMNGLEGVVTGAGGLMGAANQALNLHDISLTGAPAIDLDLSSGTLTDVTLVGEGSGTGFLAHHGRSSESLIVEDMTVNGYSVGISLHSDVGEISAPFILRSSSITAPTTLSAEHHPARLESSSMIGTLDILGTDVVAVDGQSGSISAGLEATYVAYRTITLDAQRQGVPVSALFTVVYEGTSLSELTVTGTTVDVELLLRTVTSSDDIIVEGWNITADVVGSPSAKLTVQNPVLSGSFLAINVLLNAPPTVSLTEPYPGQRVMESRSLRASATASDDLDATSDLTLAWRVYDLQGNTVLQGGNEPVYNITDLSAGYYIVEVTATDSMGLSSSASVDIEYTQLDTDGDWTSTCSSDTWFDGSTGKSCGPDVYDEDDDNDGFSDEKDAFPLDPCAQIDTDGDTQPDVLDCPPGQTSWLTEDMDDDGDGVPDVLEGVEADDNDLNINALLVVLALLVIVVLLFFARLRRGGPGDLSGLDQRHM